MIDRRRLATLGIAATGLIACASAAPHYMRGLDAFRVRQVEVIGTRFLKPHQALAASGIDTTASVFDDPEVWRAALLTHPLVRDAHVSRRPPHTVRIHVVEADPVALVRGATLRAADAEGNVLPLDPAFGNLDLPVLGNAVKVDGGKLQDERVVNALRGLAALRDLEPSISAWVSEAYAGRDYVRLVLRWPANADLLLALPIDAARLEEVQLVLADLATAGVGDGSAAGAAASGSDLTRLVRVDARFRDQVVVAVDGARK